VGKVINWDGCEGQAYGGAIMGIGRGMTEEVVYDPRTGIMLNGNLLNYKIPTMMDYGDIETIMVETGMGYGPYGSVGIGEDVVTVLPALGARRPERRRSLDRHTHNPSGCSRRAAKGGTMKSSSTSLRSGPPPRLPAGRQIIAGAPISWGDERPHPCLSRLSEVLADIKRSRAGLPASCGTLRIGLYRSKTWLLTNRPGSTCPGRAVRTALPAYQEMGTVAGNICQNNRCLSVDNLSTA
jgi:hypothetical protein